MRTSARWWVVCLALIGCGGGGASQPRELVVFAASSLRGAFGALGERFEAAHPGVTLRFNFAGTQELRMQIEHGAAADVFASADEEHMSVLREGGLVAQPTLLARNEPVVIVATEANALHAFTDLPAAARIVLGAQEVPIGRYTQQILERVGGDFRAQVEAKVVSRELNVKQVVAKVSLGEADAGIVYRTDALAGVGRVRVVEIPSDVNVIATYPIAIARKPPQPELARAFVDAALGAEGQDALRKAGFLPAR